MGSVRGRISGRLHSSMVLEFDRKPSMFYLMSHSKLRLWPKCAIRRTNRTSSVCQSLRRYAYFQFHWSISCSAPVVGCDLSFSVVASLASRMYVCCDCFENPVFFYVTVCCLPKKWFSMIVWVIRAFGVRWTFGFGNLGYVTLVVQLVWLVPSSLSFHSVWMNWQFGFRSTLNNWHW